MGKKGKPGSNLGRSLIKDRFSNARGRKTVSDNSMLHTTEIQDGYDWGRLNLQSVTEESSFQEFLSTAELAGTEFQAEKLNITFVNPRSNVGLLTEDEKKKAKAYHEAKKDVLKIPRRPHWDSNTTPEELESNEKESFLEWRRSLAIMQEEDGIILTPYEKNLEFWRQLWRVVERSDVIVQIVDARNPLLFRCEDLEKYVKEVSENKLNLVLMNKADFLTLQQRQEWAKYFASISVRAVFFSATTTEETDKTESSNDKKDTLEELTEDVKKLETAVDESERNLMKITQEIDSMVKNICDSVCSNHINNKSEILSRNELIELFKTVHNGMKVTSGVTTIGLVGYPNVGKSSTINALLQEKKVSVSATPGKTKHFQTLYLDKDLLLCDCPGLVMPSFVFTKAEMIVNGILPIDQMRDHVPPINLVCHLIPKHIFEDLYGIILPTPMEGEDPNRCPTAEELLNIYAYNRGFMTANGQPDNPRASRYILKDFVNGKLLYCHAPPSVEQKSYHVWPEKVRMSSVNRVTPPKEVLINKGNRLTTTADLDRVFFQQQSQGVHVKGKNVAVINRTTQDADVTSKPWKKINKHENKKKREKLRRVYAHLDQH